MDDFISRKRDLLLLFLGISVFFAIGLGARPYLTPSEARYIEIPRQMLATGDFLTPRIDGVPYFEKPPLFYWMQAGVMSLFGSSEFSGRLAEMLIVTLTCLIAYGLGRALFGRMAGIFSSLVLATCALGYSLSRVAVLDAPVTLFITATVASFWFAQTSDKKNRWYYAMYVCAALAMMTKGLIGIVIPGLVIGAWIALTRKWRILKDARLFSGTLVFLAVAAPWHWLMQHAHPEFFDFYFIREHFTRYLTDEEKRTAPWWFFIAITLLGLLPWTLVTLTLPLSLSGRGKLRALLAAGEGKPLFLALWIILPLIFFSMSHSKLTSYIFPIFPPLAIVVGYKLAQLWRGELPARALKPSLWLPLILVGAAAIAYPLLPDKIAAKIPELSSIPLAPLFPLAIITFLMFVAALKHCSARHTIVLLFVFAAMFDITANFLAPSFDQKTVKPLTALIQPKPDDMVVAYESYWQDLPVYLNRNVTVVGYMGELGFGVEHNPTTRGWMIDEAEFWRRCARAPHAVYVFMRLETFSDMAEHRSCDLKVLAEYGNTVLLQKEKP